MSSTIMEKRAALLAQCPIIPSPPEAEAALLPINVERSGTDGPLVVVIHGGVQGGIGGGPATFAKQAALAGMGWRVALVERPGFGQSPSRGPDDMERDAIWISEMLGEGGHLIGHSWGGAEVLLAAARRPEAVHSLVLVEPALQGLAMIDPRLETEPALKAAVMGVTQPMLTAGTPAEYARAFMRELVGEAGAGSARNMGELDEEKAAYLGCALLRGRMAAPPVLRQAAEAVARAKIPVLVITGGWSRSLDAVARLVADVTGGRQATVTSANHFPQLENPDQFNAVVDAFMREHVPATGTVA